jgi:adenylosuccinate synthase
MPRKIVLLSGSVAAGKTTLAERLSREFDSVHVVKTKDLIRRLAAQKLRHELEAERRAMQEFGDRLDRETRGQWVRDALRRTLSQLGPGERDAVAVVDAVRIPLQIKRIRESYGHLVVHIHLRAS